MSDNTQQKENFLIFSMLLEKLFVCGLCNIERMNCVIGFVVQYGTKYNMAQCMFVEIKCRDYCCCCWNIIWRICGDNLMGISGCYVKLVAFFCG